MSLRQIALDLSAKFPALNLKIICTNPPKTGFLDRQEFLDIRPSSYYWSMDNKNLIIEFTR